MIAEDSATDVNNESTDVFVDSLSDMFDDRVTFPRRRKCHAKLPKITTNWGELLATATEKDKRLEATHPSTYVIAEDDESNSENVDPLSPLNLSAPRHGLLRNENALDLSTMSKVADSQVGYKSYTMPTYAPQYKIQNNILKKTPLKGSRQNTPYYPEKISSRCAEVETKQDTPVFTDKRGSKLVEAVARKSLFNSRDNFYESEVVSEKELILSLQDDIPKRDTAYELNGRTRWKDQVNNKPAFTPSLIPTGSYKPYAFDNFVPQISNHPEQVLVHQQPHDNIFVIPDGPAPRAKPPNKEIIVNGKSYQVLALLGKGGSSKVQLVLAKDNSLLAIKCVNLANVDEKSKMDYLNEIEHLMKMQHCRHIIRIIDHQYIPSRNLLYAVMERGDTDLSRLLKERTTSGEGIPPGMILFYWSEMLLAVKSIHDNNIIHRDLKPANFLLVQGRLKLIDFGIASSIQNEQTSVFKDSQSGTPNYMSPEAWEDLGMGGQRVVKIGRKTDVWSLGCILYTFLYGKTPFQEFTNQVAKFRAITNPHHVIKFPPVPGVPKMLLHACRRCLVHDKDKRASIEELLALINQILMTPSEVIGKLRGVLDSASFQIASKAIIGNEGSTDIRQRDQEREANAENMVPKLV